MSNKSQLTTEEREERDHLQSVVSAGIASFVEVGNALITIAEKRLYRETHGSFEPYCRELWNMSARRAYQLCEAAKTVATVNNCSQIKTESQARELAKVEPEKRVEVLGRAGDKPTAKSIKEAAECVRGEDEQFKVEQTAPKPKDAEFLAATGNASIEPRVTQYYEALETFVEDAIEHATDKQLSSMSVYAATVPKLIKQALQRRKAK